MPLFPPPAPPGCVYTLRGIFQNREVFREAIAGSIGKGLLSSSAQNGEQVSSVFRVFSPLGHLYSGRQPERIWGGWVGGVQKTQENYWNGKNLKHLKKVCKERARGWWAKDKFKPCFVKPDGSSSVLHIETGQGLSRNELLGNVLWLVQENTTNGQRRAEINCYWLSDRLIGCRGLPVTASFVCLCVYSMCFSAGLLCLRGSMCICGVFFPCPFCFGLRQLLVVILPSHPPTQRAYSIGQMLCFWDCSLSALSDFTSTMWSPPVGTANLNRLCHKLKCMLQLNFSGSFRWWCPLKT